MPIQRSRRGAARSRRRVSADESAATSTFVVMPFLERKPAAPAERLS
jgi:hypothetical protein